LPMNNRRCLLEHARKVAHPVGAVAHHLHPGRSRPRWWCRSGRARGA
jgi:hypothetical protein